MGPGGAGTLERAWRPPRGLQAGAASCEDEGRLLQGCEPARGISCHLVRLSWVPVPSPEDDVAERRDAHLHAQLPARRQSKGAERASARKSEAGRFTNAATSP